MCSSRPAPTLSASPSVSFANNAFLQRWRVHRDGGLDGSSIRIEGLEATLTDALVRVERLDGTTQTVKLSPSSPAFTVEAEPGSWEVARAYLVLGIEHILLGIDHLLFVLALMILVKGAKATAMDHHCVHGRTQPDARRSDARLDPRADPTGRSQHRAQHRVSGQRNRSHTRAGRPSLTYRKPWIVAFVFGLLHGLGFASALSEVGLPANAIPIALLFFNVGVETGS